MPRMTAIASAASLRVVNLGLIDPAGSVSSFLARGAEEARALTYHDVPDQSRAVIATFPFPAIDMKAICETAGTATRVAIVAESRATASDGGPQHHRGEMDDQRDFFGRYSTCSSGRSDLGVKEDFRRVDISDAGDDPLIHYDVLDRGSPSTRLREQIFQAESAREWLRSHPAQLGEFQEIVASNQLHNSEASGVIEHQLAAVVERELDMVVARIQVRRGGLSAMCQAAAHTEMHQQHIIAVEIDNQVFSPAAN